VGCDLHFAKDWIVVLDEPADEADDDDWRHCAWRSRGDWILAGPKRRLISLCLVSLANRKNGH
jgi:hypothetical protein